MNSKRFPRIEIVTVPPKAYRLADADGSIVGQETYGTSDVLCLGDEVLERSGYLRDSLGFVFETQQEASAARRRVTDEVLRYRDGH